MNHRLVSSLQRSLVLPGLLLVGMHAHADPSADIRAYGGDGPYGGCVGCLGHSDDQQNANAKAGDTVGFSVGDVGDDGSYGHVSGIAQLGQLHVYADAHRTYNDVLYGVPHGIGDAQSSMTTRFIDDILPSADLPSIGYANYTLTLALNGSHTSADSAGGSDISAVAQAAWDLRDYSTGHVYAGGSWDTSDAHPTTLLTIPVTGVKPGDFMQVEVSLSAFAYVMSNNAPQYLTAVVDYHDTLDVHLDALTPGANTVGVSGFNYATMAAVPEPATAALLVAGLGLIGWRRRHRVR